MVEAMIDFTAMFLLTYITFGIFFAWWTISGATRDNFDGIGDDWQDLNLLERFAAFCFIALTWLYEMYLAAKGDDE